MYILYIDRIPLMPTFSFLLVIFFVPLENFATNLLSYIYK